MPGSATTSRTEQPSARHSAAAGARGSRLDGHQELPDFASLLPEEELEPLFELLDPLDELEFDELELVVLLAVGVEEEVLSVPVEEEPDEVEVEEL